MYDDIQEAADDRAKNAADDVDKYGGNSVQGLADQKERRKHAIGIVTLRNSCRSSKQEQARSRSSTQQQRVAFHFSNFPVPACCSCSCLLLLRTAPAPVLLLFPKHQMF